jgi:SH3-like domain-containing protein
MRFNKLETHPYRAVEYIKKFAIVPLRVQGHWIWFENYYVPRYWDIKSAYHNFRAGDKVSSIEAEWRYQYSVLPEDDDYQKWVQSNSKLHDVLG